MDSVYGLMQSTILTIPRGRKGLPALQIDIQEISNVLKRVSELERMTVYTYPELITKINGALIQAARLTAIIDIECREAANSLDVAEAIARLERAEAVLSQKGIKSSADTRDAAVTLDPDVQDAIQRRDALNALSEWSRNVRMSLERMYYTAKQIVELSARMTGDAKTPTAELSATELDKAGPYKV